MEPAVRAVLHLRPQFDFTALDLITDRYVLARLLETPVRKTEFRLSAQAVHNTMIFIRSDKDFLKKTLGGFRQDIETQHLSQPKIFSDSVSHHRIITYRLGDLHIMVRHAADGFIPEDTPAMREALCVITADPRECNGVKRHGNVNIKSMGTLIPREAMLEFNTYNKASNQKQRLGDKQRETWLSQEPHFFTIGYKVQDGSENQSSDQRQATVDESDLRYYDAKEVSSKMEDEDQAIVKSFYDSVQDLIQRLHSAASSGQGNTFIVERTEGSDETKVFPSEKIPGLSNELRDRLMKKFVEDVEMS